MLVTVAIGIFSIRGTIIKSRKEASEKVKSQILEATEAVKKHVDDKISDVSHRFEAAEDDIEDIETDMKEMVADLGEVCSKLQKHDYILEGLVPDFKKFKETFYNFKTSVDSKISN
jgi:chromosome segregation ATPase